MQARFGPAWRTLATAAREMSTPGASFRSGKITPTITRATLLRVPGMPWPMSLTKRRTQSSGAAHHFVTDKPAQL
jgi:hypothetical protein